VSRTDRPQAPITADPDRSLGQELVGGPLRLGERLLRARRDRQPLGERIHHLGAREGGRPLGQPLRAGQLAERRVQLGSSSGAAAATGADLGELPLAHPLLSEFPRPPLVDALLGLRVVLRLAGRHRRRAAGLDPTQALLGQPVVDLLRALAEPLDQPPIIQPHDLGRPRALIDGTPADPQALGERRPLGRQVQVISRH
jgi:hypothetical protein